MVLFCCSPDSAIAHGHKLLALLSARGSCITSLRPLLQHGVAADVDMSCILAGAGQCLVQDDAI